MFDSNTNALATSAAARGRPITASKYFLLEHFSVRSVKVISACYYGKV
jgi:hypothetical protein